MKSRSRHHRSKWAHCNTPEALRRRRAAADARREAIAATLPPAYAGPDPLSRWQSVLVLDAHGEVMHRVDLYVPAGSARCDQHAAMIDGDRALMTATEIGAKVRGWIAKRPSASLQAEIRRDDWRPSCCGWWSARSSAHEVTDLSSTLEQTQTKLPQAPPAK